MDPSQNPNVFHATTIVCVRRGASVVVFLLLWEWAARAPISFNFPSPWSTLTALVALVRSGVLLQATLISLQSLLLGFGAAVQESAESLRPHRLAGYLYDLATAFTAFFESCPVLRAPDDAARASRLKLCALTADVLARGLDILGIDAPERM